MLAIQEVQKGDAAMWLEVDPTYVSLTEVCSRSFSVRLSASRAHYCSSSPHRIGAQQAK